MAERFVKIHYQIIDSDIYKMAPLYLRVFERLILEANQKDDTIKYKPRGSKDFVTKTIKRGEQLTSLRAIAEWVEWYENGQLKTPNAKTIKTIMDWLYDKQMVMTYDRGNNLETHYMVLKYEVYQDLAEVESNNLETTKKDASKQIPYQKILSLYHEICESYPRIKVLSDERKKHIGARYKQYKYDLDVFKELFTKAEESDFLRGENNRNWAANFDWMLNETNMAKILEGKYDNKPNPNKPQTRERKFY